ncbi:hypothetical protein F4823DRAFT_623467 [Ustulina deusta]|nr:hypothetical protein F4823DRAFT_623467 [Ustulina deusta]
MFTCRACQRRAFNTLSTHGLPKNPNTSHHSPPPFRTTAKGSRPSRSYATVATHARSADAADSIAAPSLTDAYRDGKAPALGRSAAWAARKELAYLGDPLHIANRVKLALNKDNFELAAMITRQASRDNNVTVSWNHLIDYQLGNGRIHAALKLYNDMKKRAQLPNAQTFTIIFRGCAKSPHPKLALGEAVKLYQNMLTVGRIKPNTIHLNAVLQVCAKVEDLDSMFSILSSADDPLRSPNNLTYTTIFNAMRMAVDKAPADHDRSGSLTDEEIQKGKQDTIKRAKAIWEEVMSRWRSGSLVIDEELVCAMGRILLMGGYTDIDSIESLIEQTMMISRADNKGLSGREGAESAASALPRPVIKAPGAPAIAHALPGNNSLSMILEALEKTRRTTKAIKYWNIFTLHYNVVPDVENWVRVLKVYQCGKNSGRAASALQGIPSDMLTQKHVRLAMKTCLRDNLNKSSLDNATAVLKTMGQTLSIPDVLSLRAYLQVAHASKRSFDSEAKQDYAAAMDSWAKSLAAALEHLFGPYQAVAKKCVIEAPNTSDPKALEQAQNSKAEVVALARKMSAAYDILMSEHAVSLTAVQLVKMKSRLAGLTKFINDYFQGERQRVGTLTGKREDVEDNNFKQWGSSMENNNFERRDNIRHSKSRQRKDAGGDAFERKFSNRVV